MFENFYEDKNIISNDNARTFVDKDDEDCWFEVIPVNADYFVVQTYEECERTHTSLVKNTSNMWKEIKIYIKEILSKE